MTNSH